MGFPKVRPSRKERADHRFVRASLTVLLREEALVLLTPNFHAVSRLLLSQDTRADHPIVLQARLMKLPIENLVPRLMFLNTL